MTCTSCGDIAFAPASQADEMNDQEPATLKWTSLQKTAMRGCVSCGLICSTILAGTPSQSSIKAVDAWLEEGTLGVGVDYLPLGSAIGKLEQLYPFAESETPWSSIAVNSFTTFSAPSLHVAAELIKNWLKRCEQDHTCSSKIAFGQVPRLPTRVIDVGNANREPHLHITYGEHGRYVALSHCWGPWSPNAKRLTTTRSTLASFNEKIDSHALPATFRDAIEVCRSLGLQYIWIDSLCIIQDSEKDWHDESGRMTDVYRNAYLTLAADAPHSDSGLFRRHAQSQVPTRKFLQTGSDETSHCIYVRRNWPVPGRAKSTESPSRCCYASEAKSCLDQRAWVLQERLLSPRTVHFTETEITFECEYLWECSCGLPVERRSPQTFFNAALRCAEGPTDGAEPGPAQAPELWHAVVKDFSRRRLTYSSDRLAALSGIAGAIPSPPSEYCAGLWKQTIVYDLIWFNPMGHETWKEIAGDRTRASTYNIEYPSKRSEGHAPTWTWTSITGPVKFGSRDNDDISIDWRIACIQCTPSTSNPFGEVCCDSFLEVEAYIIPVTIEERHSPVFHDDFPESILHHSIEMCVVRADRRWPGRNKTHFDVDLDAAEWRDKACSYHVLVAGTQKADHKPLAIILKRSAIAELGPGAVIGALREETVKPSLKRPREATDAGNGQPEDIQADEPPAKRTKLPTAESDDFQTVDGDENLHPKPEVAGAVKRADGVFTRIGLVRLDNWAGCDWKSGMQRRVVRVV